VDDPFGTLADRVLEIIGGRRPFVIGIAGPVAVGKSTVAAELSARLARAGRSADIVPTDAFLHPNAVLEERGITMRKGFPESYDAALMVASLRSVRVGARRVEIPVYSHATYDIVPGESRTLIDPDVLILEGVVALQEPAVAELDLPIYIDADEAHVREWFVARFLRWTDEARAGAGSFYRIFAEMNDEQVKDIAEATWDSINGVNLAQHIGPSRSNARVVIHKARDHSISEVA
jgi:type I pantothenate kinase